MDTRHLINVLRNKIIDATNIRNNALERGAKTEAIAWGHRLMAYTEILDILEGEASVVVR